MSIEVMPVENRIETVNTDYMDLKAETTAANSTILGVSGAIAVIFVFVVQQKMLSDGWVVAFTSVNILCVICLGCALFPRGLKRRSRVPVLQELKRDPEAYFNLKVEEIKQLEKIVPQKYNFIRLGLVFAVAGLLVLALEAMFA